MSSAAHYRFTADICLKNVSEETAKKLYNICDKIFIDKRNSRRSNKYWTKRVISHYRNPNPVSLDSLLRFEIEDAETVRELKRIEGQLREACSEKPFSRVITSIECRHVRTK